VLAGIGITTAMLVNVTHVRWGFIWLLLPVLLIARRLSCYPLHTQALRPKVLNCP